MLFTFIYLLTGDKREYLDTKKAKDKYGSLYKDVDLKKSKWTILYYPMFILKRLFFVFIPVVLLEVGAQ